MLIPILWGVATLVFLILYVTPGDPAMLMLGPEARPEDLAALRKSLGLDRPLHVQYGIFLSNLLRGDLGNSIVQRVPVSTLLLERLPATLLLAAAAVIFSLVVGVPTGVISAVKHQTLLDDGVRLLALLGISMPVFVRGIILIMLFALFIPIFPPSGYGKGFLERLHHLILPAVALGSGQAALIARLARSSLLEILNLDYVRTARAKGLPESRVILRHAFRNALNPLITVVGLNVAALMGGAVITETVFAWPGLGRLIIDALYSKDFPVVSGGLMLVALVFVVVNLLVDLSYGLVDPRVRYE